MGHFVTQWKVHQVPEIADPAAGLVPALDGIGIDRRGGDHAAATADQCTEDGGLPTYLGVIVARPYDKRHDLSRGAALGVSGRLSDGSPISLGEKGRQIRHDQNSTTGDVSAPSVASK